MTFSIYIFSFCLLYLLYFFFSTSQNHLLLSAHYLPYPPSITQWLDILPLHIYLQYFHPYNSNATNKFLKFQLQKKENEKSIAFRVYCLLYFSKNFNQETMNLDHPSREVFRFVLTLKMQDSVQPCLVWTHPVYLSFIYIPPLNLSALLVYKYFIVLPILFICYLIHPKRKGMKQMTPLTTQSFSKKNPVHLNVRGKRTVTWHSNWILLNF